MNNTTQSEISPACLPHVQCLQSAVTALLAELGLDGISARLTCGPDSGRLGFDTKRSVRVFDFLCTWANSICTGAPTGKTRGVDGYIWERHHYTYGALSLFITKHGDAVSLEISQT